VEARQRDGGHDSENDHRHYQLDQREAGLTTAHHTQHGGILLTRDTHLASYKARDMPGFKSRSETRLRRFQRSYARLSAAERLDRATAAAERGGRSDAS